MFKTDSASLDALASVFEESDLGRLKSLFELLQQRQLSTISPQETAKLIEGLKTIGQLKLDGKLYAFHVYDSFAEKQGGLSEGIEIFLRQGNRLSEFLRHPSRESTYTPREIIRSLKRSRKNKIYTGHFPSEGNFLGLTHEVDEEDPIFYDGLRDYEIEEFRQAEIDVVCLDSLI